MRECGKRGVLSHKKWKAIVVKKRLGIPCKLRKLLDVLLSTNIVPSPRGILGQGNMAYQPQKGLMYILYS